MVQISIQDATKESKVRIQLEPSQPGEENA